MFWLWTLRNFWNLFSLVGVLATLYLGIFYVPDYVQENRYNKSALAQQEITREIGEKIYNDTLINNNELKNLISAKQIYYNITLPYSPRQVILIVGNEFSRNQYITFEKRELLAKKIQTILDLNIEDNFESKAKESDIISISITTASIIVSLLAAILGISSIFFKHRRDSEISIELDPENSSIENYSPSHRAKDYEQLVRDAIESLGIVLDKDVKPNAIRSFTPDFEISTPKGDFIIEAKAYRLKIGVNTIRSFLHMVRESGKSGILVSTSDLTSLAKETLHLHNQKYGQNSAQVVVALTKIEISSSLRMIIL